MTVERYSTRDEAIHRLELDGAERISPTMWRLGRYLVSLDGDEDKAGDWFLRFENETRSRYRPPDTDYVA